MENVKLYVHRYFEPYFSNGSIEILGKNINWGTDEDLKELSQYAIEGISNLVNKGRFVGTFEDFDDAGWKTVGTWAIID